MQPMTIENTLKASIPRDWNAREWPTREGRKCLVIVFTPRSGSTWLGDLLTKQGTVGFPEEYLNADCLPATNVELHADRELDYLNGLLATRSTPNGIFSIETCWGDIVRFSSVDFFEYFKEAQFIHLRRRDVLSQAISLLAATESGVFHLRDGTVQGPVRSTPRKDPQEILVTDQASTFAKLRKWIAHIINFECATELQFAVRGIEPTRLYYEDMLENIESVVRKIVGLMEAGLAKTPASSFSRTSSPEALNVTGRFIEHHREFLLKATSIRPPLFY